MTLSTVTVTDIVTVTCVGHVPEQVGREIQARPRGRLRARSGPTAGFPTFAPMIESVDKTAMDELL